MSYIQQSLAPGEQVVSMFRLHWFMWWRLWIVLLIGAIVAAFAVWQQIWPVAIGVAIVALLIAGYEWLALSSIEQGVTNHRVIRKTGIVSRQSTELRLASIETVDLKQSFWGRVFRYANIEITGRGETAMFLRMLSDPLAVKRAIETAYSANVEGARAGTAA